MRLGRVHGEQVLDLKGRECKFQPSVGCGPRNRRLILAAYIASLQLVQPSTFPLTCTYIYPPVNLSAFR